MWVRGAKPTDRDSGESGGSRSCECLPGLDYSWPQKPLYQHESVSGEHNWHFKSIK